MKNCIYETSSLMDALNRLNEVKIKTLFVTDDDGHLKASLTDGDIRRAILGGVHMDDAVIRFSKCDPITVTDGEEDRVSKEMLVKELNAIPIVDANGCIIGLFTDDHLEEKQSNSVDIPVVIMAGGKGTRLYPYTKILPKPLIPVADIPISERIIRSFYENGCRDFYMIVNYKKNMIRSYFSESEAEYNVRFFDEDIPLGTGGGLKLIENEITDTFALTNCDILIDENIAEIVRHHRENGNKATMVCSHKTFEIPYGVVHFNDGGEIDHFEEKPRQSFFVNTGYYILEKEVFEYIGESEAIGMPDVLDRMSKAGVKVGIYPISENSWLDMGQFDSMEVMERRLREMEM